MPGVVSQVIEIHKSGSVPQVESETKRLGDVKGEGPSSLPLAIFRARQCGLVCSRWLVTTAVPLAQATTKVATGFVPVQESRGGWPSLYGQPLLTWVKAQAKCHASSLVAADMTRL